MPYVLFFKFPSFFEKSDRRNSKIIPISAKITFGFSNSVIPNGAIIKGTIKSKKKTMSELTRKLMI